MQGVGQASASIPISTLSLGDIKHSLKLLSLGI